MSRPTIPANRRPPAPRAGSRVRDLEQRLAEAEATIQALLSGQIDAVVDATHGTPVLLANAQAALRQSEARYRYILETTTEGVWLIDAAHKTTFMNRRMAEMLGCEVDMGLGRTPFEFLGQDERATLASRLEGRAPFQAEVRYARVDGGSFWAVNDATPVFDGSGRCEGWLALLRDVTEPRRAAEALAAFTERMERRERILTTTLSSISDFAYIYDHDGRLLFANQPLLDLWGFTLENAVGKTFADFGFSPDLSERMQREVREVFDTGHSVTGEAPYTGSTGVAGCHEYILSPAFGPDGRVEFVAGSTRDVSARRQVEVELRALKDCADAANQSKSRFLATMSHEIRTPMNAILGMADLLWESRLDATQRQYVEIFRRNGQTLLALINDILDLSKIEADRFEFERIAFSLDEVLQQALELIALRTRSKGLTLALDRESSTPSALVGDPVRLRQILVNLLGNAVKFTDRGTITLAVSNAASGIPGAITFAVVDSGTGIPAEQLEHVFADFAQADSSTTRRFGGTGLGLGISRRFVERMGGQLTATSTTGHGSTFTFSVAFELAAPHRVPREVVNLEGRRILLIDDDAINRLALRETLAAWGAETDDFGQSERALAQLAAALAEQRPYALAIVDGLMPGVDGFEAARRIRVLAPDLPIVMVASDTERGDELRRAEAGISGFALKPINRPELLRVISSAMGVTVGTRERVEPAEPYSTDPRGLSILVAEDFADNRVLVDAYLRGSPHTVTFADDGRHALELFMAGRFDLILMDVQMPVVDGLEATRSIRAFEARDGRRRTPIVVVTAGAGPDDIEASRQAGCDEHLSKPLSKRTLFEAIGRWLGAAPGDGAPRRIEVEVGEGFEDLSPAYVAGRRTDVTDATALLAQGDFAGVSRLAHNMAGTGGSYGFGPVTELGRLLEESARAGDRSLSAQHLGSLRDYLDRVHLTIRR